MPWQTKVCQGVFCYTEPVILSSHTPKAKFIGLYLIIIEAGEARWSYRMKRSHESIRMRKGTVGMDVEYIYSDGGRKKYYKARHVRDCACRALAISTNRDYKESYELCNKYIWECTRSRVTVRNGMATRAVKEMMKSLGYRRVNCENRNVHISDTAKKKGTFYILTKNHALCMKDGIIYDTWNSGRANPKVRYYYRISG